MWCGDFVEGIHSQKKDPCDNFEGLGKVIQTLSPIISSMVANGIIK